MRRGSGANLGLLVPAIAAWIAASSACREPAAQSSSAPKGTAEVRRSVPRQVEPYGANPIQYMILEPGEREAVIVYCGVSHGQIEACSCGNNPSGGLTKAATVLDRLRAGGTPLVHVHPGDLFSFEKKPAKMSFVAEAAAVLDYDAIAFGDQELIDGLPRFQKLATQYTLPFVSANVLDRDNRPVAPAHVVKDLAGVKVGIFAVLGDERYLYMVEDFMKEVAIQPVVAGVDATLAALREKVDYIILLSQQDKYLDRELALRFPEINLIVGGHDERLMPVPMRVNQTLIVNAGVTSDQIGVLHLAIDPNRHVRVMGHELISATAVTPGHPKIDEIYRRYLKDTGAKSETEPDPTPAVYEPRAACAACHKAIHDEFLKSKHARAWQSLVKAGREASTECWSCHSMGYGRPTGFVDPDKTPQLANVSCQACHLVAHDHAARKVEADLDYSRNQRTCEQCHTAVTSPDFNFWEKIQDIDHHGVKVKRNPPPPGYQPGG